MSLTLRKNLGRPLTFSEQDNNFLYLQSLAEGGGQGPQGTTGPQGTGTSTPVQFAAIGEVTTQGPFSTGGVTKFIKLPFSGSGNFNGVMGTASGGDFGAKLGPDDHAYQVYASADVEAGNNKTVALRLQMEGGAVLFQTECRSRTTNSGTFAKVVTDWIIVPSDITSPNESVYLTIANMTDSGDITIQRCRCVVVDLGVYVP